MERKAAKGVIRSKIYGISKHQEVIDDLREGDQLVLKREPNNSYDSNAIQIQSKNGKQLGYVKTELAAELAEELDAQKEIQCKVLMITGQGYKNKGVNVEFLRASFQSADQVPAGVI